MLLRVLDPFLEICNVFIPCTDDVNVIFTQGRNTIIFQLLEIAIDYFEDLTAYTNQDFYFHIIVLRNVKCKCLPVRRAR